MKNFVFLTLMLQMQFNIACQSITIDYWKNGKNSFSIERMTYLNNKLSKTKKIIVKKENLTFKFNNWTIYHSPTTFPEYPNFELEVKKRLDLVKMPNIDYTTILCLIVSSSGELLYSGIYSGFGFPYDYEVIKAVNKLGKWKPGKYGSKNVDCLFLVYYKHIII